jgi:hypothetical protein
MVPANPVTRFGLNQIPSHNQLRSDLTEIRRFSHNVVIRHGISTRYGFFDQDRDHVLAPAIGTAFDDERALDFGIAFHFLGG